MVKSISHRNRKTTCRPGYQKAIAVFTQKGDPPCHERLALSIDCGSKYWEILLLRPNSIDIPHSEFEENLLLHRF